MHAKTNDELVEMIYDGNDKDDEALQQLIHNLIPMMLKLLCYLSFIISKIS